MTCPDDITLAAEDPTSPDALAPMAELNGELHTRYPGSSIHGLDPSTLSKSGGVFVIARAAGQPVGCGALRPLDAGIAEIKRMFVVPAYRSRGIARRVLASLETATLERRFALLRLETGLRQPEAIHLYESAGYIRIAAFGEYVGDPHSVCMEKRLR
jgi:GNAT superfamily N-acetyltransferase